MSSVMRVSITYLLILAFQFLIFNSTFGQTKRSGKSKSNVGVKMILDKLDANKNGVLEPNELSARTKDFVRKSGLDPNRAHSIQTIIKKMDEQGKAKSSKDKGNQGIDGDVARKVPGFGVEQVVLGVPDFSPSGEERMTDEAMRNKFGDTIMGQVDRTLSRYDRDKNGLIDQAEQARTRWTNPSAGESDTNGDGNLSRLELAYRYKKRADDAKKKSSRGRTTRTSRTSSNNSKTKSKTVGRTSSSYSNRNTTKANIKTGLSRRTTVQTSSSKKRFNSGKDAYERYAEGLLKNYDKNKDRKLSKSEMEEMRRKPKNADINKDGYVDKSELIAYVSNRSSNSRSTAEKTDLKASSSRLGGLKRGSSKSTNEQESAFDGKDANGDGQLQMVEFTDQWTDELADEFRSKDFNRDGVITEEEWRR